MENILWAGFSMTLFAAILNATKRNQNVSDKILSAWLFLFAFDYGNLGITYITFSGNVLPSSFFLYSPAFFIYAKSLTDSNFSLKWIQLLHLLPYLFFEIIKRIFPLNININNFFDNDTTLWIRLIYAISIILSLVIYNLLSIIIVHKHRKNLKNVFSNITDNQEITWLLFILIIFMVYIFSVTFLGFMGFVVSNFYPATVFNYAASLFLTFTLGIYGIKQEDIFNNLKKELKKEEPRYKQSSLSKEDKLIIKNKILKYFEKESTYLNSELNMPMLSKELQIPKYQLTEVLNTEIGKNFFLFVNEYRVKAVKEKLSNPENDKFSIESIAYDCGFSSKSSFFSVFKSITKKTPLEYRKLARK